MSEPEDLLEELILERYEASVPQFNADLDPLAGYQREYVFAKPRRWRFDFAWPKRFLAVEVEGGIWIAGRHTRGGGFEKDNEKYAEAAILGWRILRVSPGQVKSGQAVDWIVRALGINSSISPGR